MLALLVLRSPGAAQTEQPMLDADVLVQAGHEGRPDCSTEPSALCNNLGAKGELPWTPIVADEVTRVLRASGYRVLRESANLEGVHARVREAIFIHFDGNDHPCASSASIGFPDPPTDPSNPAHSQEAAHAWKELYGRYIPFGFQPDNFTIHLRTYYGYKHVTVTDAALVIELGEVSCPAQRRWLAEHLILEGDVLAYFIGSRMGGGVSRPFMRVSSPSASR